MATDIKTILASKRAEMAALVKQGTVGASAVPAAAINTNQVSSTENFPNNINNMPQQLSGIKGVINEKMAADAIAVFEDNDFRPLKKIIRHGGNKLLAVEGFFYAQDEADVTILNDYARRHYCTRVILDDLFSSNDQAS